MNDLERERGPLVDPMPEPTMEQVSEYKPSKTSLLKDFSLQIEFLDRGCIVSVGCKKIAFESIHEAMVAINDYVANPWDEQQKWRKILD
jgi:hypothetical protein